MLILLRIFLLTEAIGLCTNFKVNDLVISFKNFTKNSHTSDDLKNKFQQLKNLECMPNSYVYNETCIYFSSTSERLSWFQAEKFCKKLPLNTSLLVIHNQHHFEFIRQMLLQLKVNETSQDDLMFLIGFRNELNSWKWTNNKTLNKQKLSKIRLGNCGSMVLIEDDLILRGSPCATTNTRFACQYTIDYCYENKCANNGKCINLPPQFRCDCQYLWSGMLCEKLNWKNLQTIIACAIAVVFLLISFLKNMKFSYIKRAVSFKSNSFTDSKQRLIWSKIRSIKTLSFILKLFSVIILIQIQIFFIHSYTIFGHFDYSFNTKAAPRHSNPLVKWLCNSYETYYLFLELIYLSFSLLFFALVVILKLTSRNSSMQPYSVTKRYISSAIYIAYTHDIIKMFTYFFLTDFNGKILPVVGHQAGILTDLVIKFMHTILIGTKFFPLLIGLDSRSVFMDFACFVYVVVVWVLELSTLTFCENDSNKYLNAIESIFNVTNFKLNATSMRNVYNGTFTKLKSNEFIVLIENLPVYTCMSLLFVYYFFSFLENLIKWCFNGKDLNFPSTAIHGLAQSGKFSRHFVSLVSVAFMVAYFLTIIGVKFVSVFSSNITAYLNMAVVYIFKQPSPFIATNLFSEFFLTFLITFSVIIIQLSLFIKNFRNDLKLLEKGETLFKGLTLRSYLDKYPHKRSQICLSSLHFPGYLIAHVLYSYFIFSMIIFLLIICVKLIGYIPSVFFESFIRFILPLLIVLFFRLLLMKHIEKLLFSSDRNPNLYYVYSYFQFFSDCLVGLISCLSRIWKTACYTCVMLPRLDKSMFNQNEKSLLNILDKGHSSYLDYVRREYLYGSSHY